MAGTKRVISDMGVETSEAYARGVAATEKFKKDFKITTETVYNTVAEAVSTLQPSPIHDELTQLLSLSRKEYADYEAPENYPFLMTFVVNPLRLAQEMQQLHSTINAIAEKAGGSAETKQDAEKLHTFLKKMEAMIKDEIYTQERMATLIAE